MSKEDLIEAADADFEEYLFKPALLANGVIDYTNIEHNKIFLANKKNILTKPRPQWIPEFDLEGLKSDHFLPACIKDNEGNYYVSTKVLTGYKEKVKNDYKKTIVKEPVFANKTYKMTLAGLVATVDYYIKWKRAYNKENNIDEQVGLPRSSHSMTEDRYKRIVNLIPYLDLEDTDFLTKIYPRRDRTEFHIRQNQLVFDSYNELKDKFKNKKIDMDLQKTDYINAHSKGEETSYGHTNLSNSLYDQYGVMIKKQNGKSFNSEEIKKIENTLEDIFDYYGNLKNSFSNYNLTYSYADNVCQHARKAIGLFTPYYNAIGVSFFKAGNGLERSEFASLIFAHETAHYLDAEAGKEHSHYFASDKEGTPEYKIAEAFKKAMLSNRNGKTLGDYWRRTCECFARAFEEDYAITHDIAPNLFEEKGYLPKDIFIEQIQPLVTEYRLQLKERLMQIQEEKKKVDIRSEVKNMDKELEKQELGISSNSNKMRSFELTDEHYTALQSLAEKSKMEWFYEELNDSKTITEEQVRDISSAMFMVNLDSLSEGNLNLVFDFFKDKEELIDAVTLEDYNRKKENVNSMIPAAGWNDNDIAFATKDNKPTFVNQPDVRIFLTYDENPDYRYELDPANNDYELGKYSPKTNDFSLHVTIESAGIDVCFYSSISGFDIDLVKTRKELADNGSFRQVLYDTNEALKEEGISPEDIFYTPYEEIEKIIDTLRTPVNEPQIAKDYHNYESFKTIYHNYYDELYNSHDWLSLEKERIAMRDFDYLMENDASFKELVSSFAKERGDFFSSDRECAAVVLSLRDLGMKLAISPENEQNCNDVRIWNKVKAADRADFFELTKPMKSAGYEVEKHVCIYRHSLVGDEYFIAHDKNSSKYKILTAHDDIHRGSRGMFYEEINETFKSTDEALEALVDIFRKNKIINDKSKVEVWYNDPEQSRFSENDINILTKLGFQPDENYIKEGFDKKFGDRWIKKIDRFELIVFPERKTDNTQSYCYLPIIYDKEGHLVTNDNTKTQKDFPTLMGVLLSIASRTPGLAEDDKKALPVRAVDPLQLVQFMSDSDKEFYLHPDKDSSKLPFVIKMKKAIEYEQNFDSSIQQSYFKDLDEDRQSEIIDYLWMHGDLELRESWEEHLRKNNEEVNPLPKVDSDFAREYLKDWDATEYIKEMEKNKLIFNTFSELYPENPQRALELIEKFQVALETSDFRKLESLLCFESNAEKITELYEQIESVVLPKEKLEKIVYLSEHLPEDKVPAMFRYKSSEQALEYTFSSESLSKKEEISDYFSEHQNQKERTDYLKKLYGFSSHGQLGYNVTHDGKGTHLEVLINGKLENVSYKWNEVVETIETMIEKDSFFTKEEKMELEVQNERDRTSDALTEETLPDKIYRYYLTHRPVDIGTQPSGFINGTNYDSRQVIPEYALMETEAFGYVEYDRPLTDKEIYDYELLSAEELEKDNQRCKADIDFFLNNVDEISLVAPDMEDSTIEFHYLNFPKSKLDDLFKIPESTKKYLADKDDVVELEVKVFQGTFDSLYIHAHSNGKLYNFSLWSNLEDYERKNIYTACQAAFLEKYKYYNRGINISDRDWKKQYDSMMKDERTKERMATFKPVPYDHYWKKDDSLIGKLADADKSNRPSSSMWGQVDFTHKLGPGIYMVNTPSHGGIMIHESVGNLFLAKSAIDVAYNEKGWYQFEEDCDAAVAILELYRNHIKDGFDFHKGDEEKYNITAQESACRWNENYWNDFNTAMNSVTVTRIIDDEGQGLDPIGSRNGNYIFEVLDTKKYTAFKDMENPDLYRQFDLTFMDNREPVFIFAKDIESATQYAKETWADEEISEITESEYYEPHIIIKYNQELGEITGVEMGYFDKDYNLDMSKPHNILKSSDYVPEDVQKVIKEKVMDYESERALDEAEIKASGGYVDPDIVKHEKDHSETAEWLFDGASNGMLSKYINSEKIEDIEKFRQYAAQNIEGNPQDKTYFAQMWLWGNIWHKNNYLKDGPEWDDLTKQEVQEYLSSENPNPKYMLVKYSMKNGNVQDYGKRFWSYIPGNSLEELKKEARLSFGRKELEGAYIQKTSDWIHGPGVSSIYSIEGDRQFKVINERDEERNPKVKQFLSIKEFNDSINYNFGLFNATQKDVIESEVMKNHEEQFETILLDDKNYTLRTIPYNNEEITLGTEDLNDYINSIMDNDFSSKMNPENQKLYNKLKSVDEKIYAFVPQDILMLDDENEIIKFMKDNGIDLPDAEENIERVVQNQKSPLSKTDNLSLFNDFEFDFSKPVSWENSDRTSIIYADTRITQEMAESLYKMAGMESTYNPDMAYCIQYRCSSTNKANLVYLCKYDPMADITSPQPDVKLPDELIKRVMKGVEDGIISHKEQHHNLPGYLYEATGIAAPERNINRYATGRKPVPVKPAVKQETSSIDFGVTSKGKLKIKAKENYTIDNSLRDKLRVIGYKYDSFSQAWTCNNTEEAQKATLDIMKDNFPLDFDNYMKNQSSKITEAIETKKSEQNVNIESLDNSANKLWENIRTIMDQDAKGSNKFNGKPYGAFVYLYKNANMIERRNIEKLLPPKTVRDPVTGSSRPLSQDEYAKQVNNLIWTKTYPERFTSQGQTSPAKQVLKDKEENNPSLS